MSEVVSLKDSENNGKPKNIISCYVDPNTDLQLYGPRAGEFVPAGGDSGKLMIPPEDLSIYVSLIVLPHRGTEWGGDNRNIEISFELPKQSIPSGKEYMGAKVRYLTTDYLDYGWDTSTDMANAGQPETLGIRSINIDYTNWHVPRITVSLVDIMGQATFSPMQRGEERDENNKKIAVASLFKALYTMPYPRFLLTVKGFYGYPVTHSLLATNIVSEVDTQSGNINITLTLEGFRVKRYRDIMARWILISPYLQAPTDMGVLWEERNYLCEDGKPIPKYEELRTHINSAIESIGKLPQSSSMGKTKMMINDILVLSTEIMTVVQKTVVNNPFMGLPKLEVLTGNKTEELWSIYGLHYEIESKVPNVVIWESNGWIDVSSEQYEETCNNIRNALYEVVNKYNDEIKILEENNFEDLSIISFPMRFYYYYDQNPEGKKTKILLHLTELITLLQNNQIKINTQSKKRDVEIMNQIYEQALNVVNQLPFVPTLYNVIKWVFAHYVHFLESFLVVGKKNELRDKLPAFQLASSLDKRLQLLEKWNEEDGDVTPGGTTLPWFVVREYSDTKEGLIKRAPHEAFGLPEIQYTKSMYDEIAYMVSRLAAEAAAAAAAAGEGDPPDIRNSPYLWIPIFPYDISCKLMHTGVDEINPYKKVLENYESVYEGIGNLGIQIITRMFASIGTREDIEDLESYAEADANNIFDAVKVESKICESLLLDLQGNDFVNFLLSLIDSNEDWGEDYKKPTTYNFVKTAINFTRGGEPRKMGALDSSTNKFSSALWSVNYQQNGQNNIMNATPLSTITYVDMLKGKFSDYGSYIIDDTNVWLFSFGNMVLLENSYSRFSSMNMVKGSFNIVDLTETTLDNLRLLYNHFHTNNKEIVDDVWVNISGFTKEEVECFSDDIQSISMSTPQHFANLVLGSVSQGITVENFKEVVMSQKQGVSENQLFMKLSETKPDICIAIPRLDKHVFSIFATPDYYNCTITNIDVKNRCRAALLLHSLGLLPDKLYQYIEKTNWGIKRIPKCFALQIGSILWLYDNVRSKVITSSQYPFLFREIIQPLENTFLFKKVMYDFGMNMGFDVKKVFISHFEDWVEKEGKDIIKDMEYGVYDNPVSFLNDNRQVFSAYNNVTSPLRREIATEKLKGMPAYNSAMFIHPKIGDVKYHIAGFPILQLILDPSSNAAKKLMGLYKDSVLIINSRSGILKTERKSRINIPKEEIVSYLKVLNEELLKLMTGPIIVGNSLEEDVLNTEENTQLDKLYFQFKLLHDSWFVGVTEPDITNRLEHIMSKIMIVDQYFCDISDKVYVNLEYIKHILTGVFTGETAWNMYDLLANIAQEHNLFMMASPTLGFFEGRKATDAQSLLDYLFKPQIYNEIDFSGTQDEDYGLIFMLMGNPAETPTDLDNEESDFENTALQLTRDEDMLALNKGKHLVGDSKIPLRSFGISYGRHNENFFKIENLTMSEPKKTEQYFKSMVRILESAKDYSSGNQVFVGENLYSQYSKMAYNTKITLEGGSAPIFPLMYYQLNNTYLFTGGYMIFKVVHTIEDNYMRTVFEGVKQDFTKRPIVKIPLVTSIVGDLKMDNVIKTDYQIDHNKQGYGGEIKLNQVGYNNGGGTKKYGPGGIITDDKILGEQYMQLRDKNISKHFKLHECVERGSNSGNIPGSGLTGPQAAGFQMPIECFENLADFLIQVDKIIDWVKDKNGLNQWIRNMGAGATDGVGGMNGFSEDSEFDIMVGSMWRHHSNSQSKTSYHGHGSGIDLRLRHKAKGKQMVDVRGNKDMEFHYKTLYAFIAQHMNPFITELYLEYKGTDKSCLNTVHYAYTKKFTKYDICACMGLTDGGGWRCDPGRNETSKYPKKG